MRRGGRTGRGWRDRPAAVALALGIAGLGYRLTLLLLDVPGSNSDEGTFGLVAMHIAQGRERPVYLYGQHYMGVLESYLAAPLFVFFPPSWLLLRLPLLLLYALFVVLAYRLTRELYSPWLAAFTVGLLALGSERVIRDQMTAVGGRAEAKPAVVALLLIAIAVAAGRIRRPRLALAAFGLLAGVGLWSDWLVAPYLAAAAAVLLVGAGRTIPSTGWALLLGGFTLGALPMIVDNLTAPHGHDSWSVLRRLHVDAGRPAPLADHLRGALLTGVPLATGLCPASGCAPWQMSWGVLAVALLLVAAALAAADLWRRRGPAAGSAADDARARRARAAARLALAAAALVTVVAYARSPAAAHTPLTSARYLTYLQISLPAALWPLCRAGAMAPSTAGGWWRRMGGRLALALLATTTVAMALATAGQIAAIGPTRAEERRAQALAETLVAAGITHVYGEYWTCNRLIFYTRERVICAVVGANLRPGHNRYAPYLRQVHAAPRPAYALVAGDPADRAFRARLAARGISARVTEVGSYRVYEPAVPLRP